MLCVHPCVREWVGVGWVLGPELISSERTVIAPNHWSVISPGPEKKYSAISAEGTLGWSNLGWATESHFLVQQIQYSYGENIEKCTTCVLQNFMRGLHRSHCQGGLMRIHSKCAARREEMLFKLCTDHGARLQKSHSGLWVSCKPSHSSPLPDARCMFGFIPVERAIE